MSCLPSNSSDPTTDLALANMVDLRKAVSDVLALLLGSQQTSEIDEALFRTLQFFDVDRVYVGTFDTSTATVDFTNEVTCDGIVSMREDLLRQLSKDEIPWWIDNIQHGKDIIIRDVSKMPSEAFHEQYLLQLQEVLSLLVIPVFMQGKPFGFIGLDSVKRQRDWTALDVENLRILADILSIAIERKEAQGKMEHNAKQVLKSETKFQIIFDKMPWGAELYNEKGRLIDINQADLDIFGVTREKAIGLNMFTNPNIPDFVNKSLLAGEDISFTLDYNFVKAAQTKYYDSSNTVSHKHLLVKGVCLKDPQDNIFGFLYIVFDDSENYQKKEQIKDALARLKVSVDTGDSILWEYDVEKDIMVVDFGLNDDISNNEGLVAVQNTRFNNIEDYCDSLHPDDFDRVYNKQFKPLLEGKIKHFVAAYRRILHGKEYWFNTNARSYKSNEDGSPSKILCYTTDITKQREKEIELIKVKEADKLKSAFLANMSHEIRTPLNAIVGFSDIIAEVSDEQERQSYLDIIHKNNDLLLQLIDDILDFSKIEAGTMDYHLEDVDIKDICNEIILADSIKMPAGVSLLFDPDTPSVIITTDERRIMQVLSNFMNNAIKFTPKGNITLSYHVEKDKLRVCVSDTGIGISAKNQWKIFERFIKVDSFQQGTGLGLTICKTIIEELGGTIGVDSTEGLGSTFWFTLPMTGQEEKKESVMALSTESRKTASPEKIHTILIAEDVYENYYLLETILGKKYQLYHANNGQEAIDMFKKYHPDLILMDIKMPVMDGFEATRIIRSESNQTPIIALTAFAFERDKERARQCNFTDYVVKPVNINELRNLIQKVLS